jgi:hypothetical protein
MGWPRRHPFIEQTWPRLPGFAPEGRAEAPHYPRPAFRTSQQIPFKEAWAEFIARVVFQPTRGCDRPGFDNNANTDSANGSARPRGCQSLWHRGADGFPLDGCWRCINGGEVSAAHAYARGALSPCAGGVDRVHVLVCAQRSLTCLPPLLLADCAACSAMVAWGRTCASYALNGEQDYRR